MKLILEIIIVAIIGAAWISNADTIVGVLEANEGNAASNASDHKLYDHILGDAVEFKVEFKGSNPGFVHISGAKSRKILNNGNVLRAETRTIDTTEPIVQSSADFKWPPSSTLRDRVLFFPVLGWMASAAVGTAVRYVAGTAARAVVGTVARHVVGGVARKVARTVVKRVFKEALNKFVDEVVEVDDDQTPAYPPPAAGSPPPPPPPPPPPAPAQGSNGWECMAPEIHPVPSNGPVMCKLQCGASEKIQVIWATYGTTTGSFPNLNKGSCALSTAFAKAKQYCDGKKGTCEIGSSNEIMGGDPCAWTSKTLVVDWKCIADDDDASVSEYYGSGGGNSRPCFDTKSCPSDGYYLTENCAQCQSCPAGTASNGVKNLYLQCKTCEAGKYAAGYTNNQCTPCPQGYTSSAGSSVCKPVACQTTASCSTDGYYILQGCPMCGACTPGTASNGVKNLYLGCTSCSAGKFAPGYQSNTCTPCPSGQTSGVGATTCTGSGSCPSHLYCNAGYHATTTCTNCMSCKRGTASGPNNRNFAECPICPAGKFQSENGGTTCNSCPYGSTSTAGQVSCTGGPAPSPSRNPLTNQMVCKAAEAYGRQSTQSCNMVCPGTTKIKITRAAWGDLFVTKWPAWYVSMAWSDGTTREACFDSYITTAKVKALCEGKKSPCSVAASSTVLGGDPCKNIRKNLIVDYTCVN